MSMNNNLHIVTLTWLKKYFLSVKGLGWQILKLHFQNGFASLFDEVCFMFSTGTLEFQLAMCNNKFTCEYLPSLLCTSSIYYYIMIDEAVMELALWTINLQPLIQFTMVWIISEGEHSFEFPSSVLYNNVYYIQTTRNLGSEDVSFMQKDFST